MLQVQDEKLIRTTREKDMILEKFRNRGMRITKQRRLILDIVFEQDCTSCKEIYYQASKRDKNNWNCNSIPDGKCSDRAWRISDECSISSDWAICSRIRSMAAV